MTTELYRIIVKAALKAFLSLRFSNRKTFTEKENAEFMTIRNIEVCIKMTEDIEPIQSDMHLRIDKLLEKHFKRILKNR